MLWKMTAGMTVVRWIWGLLVAGISVFSLPSLLAEESGSAGANVAGEVNSQMALLEQAAAEYQAAQSFSGRDLRSAKFARSEQLYRQAIEALEDTGVEPGASIWVNLGNAALQAQHVGHAIVAFRTALRQDPDHEQALQNLSYARSTVADWAARSQASEVVETLFFWKGMYARGQIQTVAAVFFAIAALLVAVSIASRKSLWRNLALLPAGLWCVLVLSTLVGGDSANEAVITAQQTVLYSSDSENAAPRLSEPLPDGTELEVLQSRERWVEVRLAGKTGWVRASAITTVQ